ncbi:MAG: hypothetical protein IKS05_08035 [Oscillospiraceae bacterium]|nr:hypothetical protein [Oscillospiraceae bacterium]
MMSRNDTDRIAAKASFRQLSFPQKLAHIWLYNKWFFILGAAALIAVGAFIHRELTKKEPVLYMGWVNTVVGSQLEETLGPGYVKAAALDPEKQEVLFYRELYLAEDDAMDAHRAAYAARIKLMASIEEQQLDLVLMSRAAWDILSGNGYLLELPGTLPLPADMEALLRENAVIQQDNELEYLLNEAESHEVVTVQAANALELTELPLFRDAGFDQPVYLGILANSPRLDRCGEYLAYLLDAE